MMDVRVIFLSGRCVTLEMDDGSVFEGAEREIFVNGE